MSESLRNRLFGGALVGVGVVGVLASPELSGGVQLIFSFAEGAALGAGGALLITGEPLWDANTWQASKRPPTGS